MTMARIHTVKNRGIAVAAEMSLWQGKEHKATVMMSDSEFLAWLAGDEKTRRALVNTYLRDGMLVDVDAGELGMVYSNGCPSQKG